MAKKKDFAVGGAPPAPVAIARPFRASSAELELPLPHGSTLKFSFRDEIGRGYDEVVLMFVESVRQMIRGGRLSAYSIESLMTSGLKQWFEFCREQASAGSYVTCAGIDKRLLEAFAGWLSLRVKANGERISINTARTNYAKIKTVFEDLSARRLLPPPDALFPLNPFPRATALENRRAYILPLSDAERERIIGVLATEMAQVFDGTHTSSLRVQISLCCFAVFLKTGLNATPLLELPRDLSSVFVEHPRVNRKVMVLFKRRAGKDVQTPVPAETRVVSLDIYRICQKAVALTEDLAQEVTAPHLASRLWLFRSAEGIRGLALSDLHSVAEVLARKHNIVRDDGKKLRLTSQLFRNTKHNRVWRASRGDLLATALTMGNTPQEADRYLAVTPEMQEEHRLAGEVMVATLTERGEARLENTPVASCRDPYHGDLAPKNGKPCVDFLSCFRCKSQVITGDDLYRLFSFYWAVLGERARIGSKNWRKTFSWITRVIDREIAPKFDAGKVELVKEQARREPHPMWRSQEALQAIGSVL